MSRAAMALLVGYLALTVAEQVTDAARWRLADGVLIALLMPVLIAFLLSTRPANVRLARLTVLALVFSWLGDTIGGAGLLVKIGLFIVTQLAYATAFWPDRRRSVLVRPPALVGYLVVLAAAITVVATMAGGFAPAIIGYGCALGAMAILATGLNRIAGFGGALFVISDLSLAVGMFRTGPLADGLGFVVMPTYLVAQLLLVSGVIVRQRAEQARLGSGFPDRPATVVGPHG